MFFSLFFFFRQLKYEILVILRNTLFNVKICRVHLVGRINYKFMYFNLICMSNVLPCVKKQTVQLLRPVIRISEQFFLGPSTFVFWLIYQTIYGTGVTLVSFNEVHFKNCAEKFRLKIYN